jgi:hypothetical protein
MKNGTGYLARWALAAIPGIGLLLLAGSGPALAGVNGTISTAATWPRITPLMPRLRAQ